MIQRRKYGKNHMENKTICVIRDTQLTAYPGKDDLFRPSSVYPESPFPEVISRCENNVYEMVREGLHMLGLDEENYGSPHWNPLKYFISPGNRVLLKPNMVLDRNDSNGGVECLYTHPSVVAALIDYVVIALGKEGGEITIGDSPVQECCFETLTRESGYKDMVEFYASRGVQIRLVDFRNIKTYEKDGLHYAQEGSGDKEHGILVQLGEKSAFADCPSERLKKMRITNYDPRILQEYHAVGRHNYKIAKEVLQADAIINISKPKTHRKAGITSALKNLVGINANKECLPHHTLGSQEEGGDAYIRKNLWMDLSDRELDIKNILIREGHYGFAAEAEKLHRKFYQAALTAGPATERYGEGSWYGNDTIWRTIADLNRIAYFADKEGVVRDTPQRKIFHVGDMIVSGQKEGPLLPTPIHTGLLVFGQDPLYFDKVVCSIMGFDYRLIPSIERLDTLRSGCFMTDDEKIEIVSNYKLWNGRTPDWIRENDCLRFEPSRGWERKLGNLPKKQRCERIKAQGGRVIVFGAGENGIYAAQFLEENGIHVSAFCDNDKDKQDKEVWNGIKCLAPDALDTSCQCIIAVQRKYHQEIINQLEKLPVGAYAILD